MGLFDVVKGFFKKSSNKKGLSWSDIRPTGLDWMTRGIQDIGKLPTLPGITFRFCYDMYYNSDLIRTIVRSIVYETFRNGIVITPNFVKKCVVCGAEFQTGVSRCTICNGQVRDPDKAEYQKLQKMLHDVNLNDQTLVEVLQEIDTDLNVVDNAFLAVVKKYYFSDDGELVGAEPVEVLRVNPENVALVMDRSGRYGRHDDGRYVMFCLEHRDVYELLHEEELETKGRCKICGKRLFPAYFRFTKGMPSKYIYFTNGEMLHIKKFTSGIGFGMPPIFTVWMKAIILMKMDWFVLTAYHLERPPKGLLILKGNRESIETAWRRLQEEAKVNPHMIYPLVVEGGKEVKQVAEWIDLTIRAQDIDFIQFRDELRRSIGALWGVMPIFTGDTGAGYGLANEGLQILVTNRTVKVEQMLFNSKVLPWLCKSLGFRDWSFELVPNEGRDIVARIQREEMRIRNAIAMKNLGYVPIAKITEDGIDFDFYEETEGGMEEIPRTSGGLGKRRSIRWMQRFEGEPYHGRTRVSEQRYEGEETEVRQPKTELVGTVGELVGEQTGDVRVPSTVEAGRVLDIPEVYDLKKEDALEFTNVEDDRDLEILKEGFSKVLKSLRLSEGLTAVLDVGFWERYAGLTKRQSDRINGIIFENILRKNLNVNSIIDEILQKTDIDRSKAELIVRTELANIANKARELAYKDKTYVKKFVWSPMMGACEKCLEVAKLTKKGVSIDELKTIIKNVGGLSARELLVHPGCRCALVRKAGRKRWWE